MTAPVAFRDGCGGGGVRLPGSGFTFASLSAGKGYTCGVTISGTAYCWGSNFAGSLGNGTLTNSPVPVKVTGQP